MSNAILDGTVQDQNGVAVPGTLVYVYDGRGESGGLSLLYDSMGQAISNPVTTDDDGYWSAYAATDRFYTFSIYWGGRKRYVEANVLLGTLGISTDPNLRADLASSTASKGAALVTFADGRTVADVRAAADITLYSDESTGSDTTGNGSSGNKFATVQKAIDAATPFLTARQTVKIVVTGNVTTNPRTTGGGAGQMERASLVYIDGVKIGKRTDIPGGVMTGGLILDLSGATLKPSTSFPTAIYCTGHSGSIGIIGGATAPQAGASTLLMAHRGCYVHVSGGTWDGGGIAQFGLMAEAGGIAECVDASFINATAQDIFVYEDSEVNLSGSSLGSASCGILYSQGVFKASGGVDFDTSVTNAGILFLEGTSAAIPVRVKGSYTGRGPYVSCSYVEWNNYTMVSSDARVRFSAVKFDCEVIKEGGHLSMTGSQSYITGPNSPQSTPIALIYGATCKIDNTNTIVDSAGAHVAPSYGTQSVTPTTSGAITPQIFGGRIHDIYCANTTNATGVTIDNTDSAGPSSATPADGQRIRIYAPTQSGVICQLVPSTTVIFDGSATFCTLGNTSDGAVEWVELEYRKAVGKWKETARKVLRSTGWTAATGTPSKGAWAAYAGQTHGAAYSQTAIQALDDAVKAMASRLLAVDQLLATGKYMKNA